MYYRITLTINRIPIHSKYNSSRLTVFTFSENQDLNALKRLLVDFTGDFLGYDVTDWWFESSINIAVQQVDSAESKGLGFYRAEVAYENDEGYTTKSERYDIRKKTFGNRV